MPAFRLSGPALSAVLAFALFIPAGAAPAKKPPIKAVKPPAAGKPAPPKPPGKTFAIHGRIAPVVKGETLFFVFLGQIKYFEVQLESKDAVGKLRHFTTKTDDRANFTLKGVPAGKYTLRVRVPQMPDEFPLGELYRGSYTVLPDDPPDREVPLGIPFLVLRPTGEDGQLVQWEQLEINLKRIGVAMDLDVQLTVATQKGANPAGPLEEKGGVVVNINRSGASVSIGWSWGSKERGIVIFPMLEEDGLVRYYFTMSRPGGEFATGKMAGNRGEFPPQLELKLRPGAVVAGRVKMPPDAVPGAVQLQVNVLDPDDLTPIYGSIVTTDLMGAFRSQVLPPGRVQVRGYHSVVKPGEDPRPLEAALEVTPAEREAGKEVEVVFRLPQERTPLPGELRLEVLDGVTGKAPGVASVSVTREDNPRITQILSLNGDGMGSLNDLRVGSYRVKITANEKVKKTTEVMVTEDEIRRGVVKKVTLARG